MKLVYENNSIECNSAEVISRKIMPGTFIELENVGKCLTYKCSRNSEAKIVKELNPKEPLHNKFSAVDLDSRLESDKIFIAILRTKPYKVYLKNHSGTHKAQTFTTDVFTFAKITNQLISIPKIKMPVNFEIIKPPEIKQISH